MNNGLMLHTGGATVDLADVDKVETPVPTETHVPIPHMDFINLAKDALNQEGWIIRQESHALAANGGNYFGLLEVDHGRLHPANEWLPVYRQDSAITIGLRNSHIGQYKAGLCAGSRVFVCDNLAFWGEVTIGRKHTKYINRDISPLMALAVGKLMEARVSDERRVLAYRQSPLEPNYADHLMMSMIRLGILPPSKMGLVLEDYEHPERRHQEFVQYQGTAFGLYMAATEHLKGNLFALPKRSSKLHALLDGASQFTSDTLTLETAGVEVDDVEMADVEMAE